MKIGVINLSTIRKKDPRKTRKSYIDLYQSIIENKNPKKAIYVTVDTEKEAHTIQSSVCGYFPATKSAQNKFFAQTNVRKFKKSWRLYITKAPHVPKKQQNPKSEKTSSLAITPAMVPVA